MRPLIGILCSTTTTTGSEQVSCPNAYVEAVVDAGGAPLLVPYAHPTEAIDRALEAVAGVLITGGPDVDPVHYGEEPRQALGEVNPHRDDLDRVAMRILNARHDMPVLGICRGIQSMNVFCGGTLIQDIPSQVDGSIKHSQSAPGWHGTHSIDIEPGTVLAETLGQDPLTVNSFHHQAVATPADGFAVSARSRDGVIEAIERSGCSFWVGVQFHPELMVKKQERLAKLFERLVEEAKRRR